MKNFTSWLAAGIIGTCIGLVILAAPPHPHPHAIDPVAASDGPRCTWVYPRGVKPTRITKTNPVCIGDMQATWRGCTSQFKA